MIALPVLAGTLPPLLALLSLLGIAWLRRRDHGQRHEVRRLCRQLLRDLDTLYARGEAIRQRALLVARIYEEASAEEQTDLMGVCYHDLERIESLRRQLDAAAGHAARVRGPSLRCLHGSVRRLEAEVDRLTSDLAQSHAFWASQLSGGLSSASAARFEG